MSALTDTIAAIATPAGRGGVGIIRISGPKVACLFQPLLHKATLAPRQAIFTRFFDRQGEIIDHGLALYFPGPHSFTGEDVLELQTHGSPVVLDWLLTEIASHPIRLARAGEFSERAFLNDKLDLAQAEAIADLIDAQSRQAARSALHSLQGDFSNKINTLRDKLIELRMYVEAAIDFPEEEIDFLSEGHVDAKLQQLLAQLDAILKQAKQGQILQEGITLVIAGRPNAGKSSLLNVLSGEETAIVTDIAGTTRDIIKTRILFEGIPVNIVDTAGIRQTTDIVEQEGIKRAKQALAKADHALLIIDSQEAEILPSIIDEALNGITIPVTVIFNKIDLTNLPAGLLKQIACPYPVYAISAKHQLGLEALKNHLLKAVGYEQSEEGQFIARRRHLEALHHAKAAILSGQKQLESYRAGELLAEDLRRAQEALGEITGEFRADDLLGEIFGKFCIGK